jgi:hypothetical protein
MEISNLQNVTFQLAKIKNFQYVVQRRWECDWAGENRAEGDELIEVAGEQHL